MSEVHDEDAARWPVPGHIGLDPAADALVVEPGTWDREVSPDVTDHRSLLYSFVALADASVEEVLDFARTWGVLELCRRHGLPLVHETSRLAPTRRRPGGRVETPPFMTGSGSYVHLAANLDEPPCDWDEWGNEPYVEPLDAWRHLALQGQAMLTLAGKLRVHSPGSPEDWTPLDDPPILPGVRVNDLLTTRVEKARGAEGQFIDSGAPSRREQVDQQRRVLAFAVDAWLAWGAVHPTNRWGHGPPGSERWDVQTLRLHGEGLFGALALQLNLEVSGRHTWATCLNCGVQYLPKRNPRVGEATYCSRPDCQRARNRDGVTKHRAKRGTDRADTTGQQH